MIDINEDQPNNPLHGITLAQILDSLVERLGWNKLGRRINIRCFNSDPSVKSSLKFLRRTPWARKKVYGKPATVELPPLVASSGTFRSSKPATVADPSA